MRIEFERPDCLVGRKQFNRSANFDPLMESLDRNKNLLWISLPVSLLF